MFSLKDNLHVFSHADCFCLFVVIQCGLVGRIYSSAYLAALTPLIVFRFFQNFHLKHCTHCWPQMNFGYLVKRNGNILLMNVYIQREWIFVMQGDIFYFPYLKLWIGTIYVAQEKCFKQGWDPRKAVADCKSGSRNSKSSWIIWI